MKSLSVLLLILSSAAFASPHFYILEGPNEVGVVTVRACDKMLEGELNCSRAFEVEESDLEEFARELSRHVNITKIMMRGKRGGKAGERKAGAGIVASLGGAISGIFLLLTAIDAWPSGKAVRLRLAGSAVLLAASAAGFVASLKLGTQKPENVDDVRLVTDESLLEEFRQGMVTGESEKIFQDEIMQRFADFLNTFGSPVS